ncbi:MAG: hypothetical protein GY927_09655 [bacterium]|nr:hypothetical protein [bacterium]
MSSDEKDEKLDRRAFFTLGIKKTAKAAVNIAQARVEQRAKNFIRPPFAIEELDFLLKCTRCDACIKACPHEIIFPLSARLGVEVVSTPALDLLSGACHLCDGWPCVVACEPQALQLPSDLEPDEEVAHPHLAIATIIAQTCLPFSGPECGACGSVCPVPGAIKWDMTRPTINEEICIGCAQCREACITEPKSITISTT